MTMENPRVEGASVNSISQSDAATELRYALDVMEEYSHLGLDDEYAGKLREILMKRIVEAEAALGSEPGRPALYEVPSEIRDRE